MFSFDEELFSKAYDKSKELIDELNTKKSDIVELRNMIGKCDYESNIETILTDIENITNTIDELNVKMMLTLAIVKNVNIGDGDLNIEELTAFFSFFYGSISGEFGTDQSRAYNLFRRYLTNPDELSETDKKRIDTIFKIFDDFRYVTPDDNFKYTFLWAISNGGCGPASITNVVIDAYSKMQNGEEIFEEKYGFPMYFIDDDGNKRYNYDALFVKLNLDNISDSFSDIYIPVIDDIGSYVQALIKACGTLQDSNLTANMQNTLGDNFQITTDIHSFGAIPHIYDPKIPFEKVIKDYEQNKDDYNYCIINARNFKLRPYHYMDIEDSNIVLYPSEVYEWNNVGHYMTVIGISENNNLIVSSWGYSFELVSSDYSSLVYINVDPKSE